MKAYFEHPQQVLFWDEDGGKYIGGIAYHDEIICGDCGGIFEICDIIEGATEDNKLAIIPFDEWIDLSGEIIGDLDPREYVNEYLATHSFATSQERYIQISFDDIVSEI